MSHCHALLDHPSHAYVCIKQGTSHFSLIQRILICLFPKYFMSPPLILLLSSSYSCPLQYTNSCQYMKLIVNPSPCNQSHTYLLRSHTYLLSSPLGGWISSRIELCHILMLKNECKYDKREFHHNPIMHIFGRITYPTKWVGYIISLLQLLDFELIGTQTRTRNTSAYE